MVIDQGLVTSQSLNRQEDHSDHNKPRAEGVAQVVKAKILEFRPPEGWIPFPIEVMSE